MTVMSADLSAAISTEIAAMMRERLSVTVLQPDDVAPSSTDSTGILQIGEWIASLGASPDPLIEDGQNGEIIGRAQCGLLYGPSGTAKTAILNEMLLAVASGRGFGHRPLIDATVFKSGKGRVLIGIYEDPMDYSRRMRGIAATRGIDLSTLDWAVVPSDLDVTTDRGREDLLRRIRADAAAHGPPCLFAIDTAPAAVGGASLNDDDLAGLLFKLGHALVREYACTTVFVCHPGKDQTRGPAGSYRLTGNSDFILNTMATKTGFRLTKRKDRGGQSDRALFDYTLIFPEVERTASGRPRTAAVLGEVIPCERESAPQHTEPTTRRKLSDRQKNALAALEEALATDGARPDAALDLSSDVRVVPVEAWRQEMMVRGIIDPESQNPRMDFKRLKDGLIARSLVGERAGVVWSCQL